jgi:hypothetical protein
MKTLIPFFAYAVLSGVLGLLVCSWLLWKSKRSSAATIAALVFWGGPLVVYGYLHFKAVNAQTSYEEDVAYMQELCAKYGGDKIYKTVDNVQGVFQIKAYNPDGDFQWADQYGMVEPWALAHYVDQRSRPSHLGIRGNGYWFIEGQPGYGIGEGPPYTRHLLASTKDKVENPNSDAVINAESFALERKELKVQTLKSRYGYTTEDLTTPELRKRWIGGGKLTVIDLQTKEVIAEWTDYYRATGAQVKMAWVNGVSCRRGESIPGFIRSVLRPPKALPTQQQLSQITGE